MPQYLIHYLHGVCKWVVDFEVTCDVQEHVTEGMFSSFGRESARALSTLAVADTMAVGSKIDMDLEDCDQSLNLHSKISNFGYPLVSSSRALKVLLLAACQGPHILSTIVKQL